MRDGRGQHLRPHIERQRLERAVDLYLDECYRRRTAARVSEFAASAGLTRSHVSQTFRRILGKSVRHVLWERQVAYAAKLLATTSHTTAFVARAAAFGTEPTFFRVFHAVMGMTPGEYREQQTKC